MSRGPKSLEFLRGNECRTRLEACLRVGAKSELPFPLSLMSTEKHERRPPRRQLARVAKKRRKARKRRGQSPFEAGPLGHERIKEREKKRSRGVGGLGEPGQPRSEFVRANRGEVAKKAACPAPGLFSGPTCERVGEVAPAIEIPVAPAAIELNSEKVRSREEPRERRCIRPVAAADIHAGVDRLKKPGIAFRDPRKKKSIVGVLAGERLLGG